MANKRCIVNVFGGGDDGGTITFFLLTCFFYNQSKSCIRLSCHYVLNPLLIINFTAEPAATSQENPSFIRPPH